MTTNKRKEKISAFLDDAINQDELMSFSLSSEPEDAKLAQRYQIMGDVMRAELSEPSFIDVSHTVREALADENISDQIVSSRVKGEVKDESRLAGVSSGWCLASWFRPAAGMTVAAFVAVVMVTTLSNQKQGGLSPAVANIDVQPTVMTADLEATGDKSITENSEEINPYINQHLEYATQDTLQGRLPFIRAVSFETEK